MIIDIEALRNYLIDYYGTAMASGMRPAMMNLEDVINATPSKLKEIAQSNGIDLSDYAIDDWEEER